MNWMVFAIIETENYYMENAEGDKLTTLKGQQCDKHHYGGQHLCHFSYGGTYKRAE